MAPIENEPKGWDENQQNNDSDFSGQTDKETKAPEIENSGNDLSGNAAGNLPEENVEDNKKQSEAGDSRGFMGDYTEPQHDD
jgi:sRNA-binding protein